MNHFTRVVPNPRLTLTDQKVEIENTSQPLQFNSQEEALEAWAKMARAESRNLGSQFARVTPASEKKDPDPKHIAAVQAVLWKADEPMAMKEIVEKSGVRIGIVRNIMNRNLIEDMVKVAENPGRYIVEEKV